MTVYDATVQAAYEPLNRADFATTMSQKQSCHEKRESECFVWLNTDVALTRDHVTQHLLGRP